MQERQGETFIDFRAQARDMDVNYIGLWIKMIIPHIFQQHSASDYLPRMLHQVLEETEFSGL